MRAQRGFTLVELLTGIAVSSIILVAVAAAVIGISGAYSNESQTRSAVEGGRTALAFVERNLRMAGYGIEPQYAFDPGTVPGISTGKDNYQLQDETTTTKRIVTDDLAFRFRDPSFVRRGAAGASTSSFTLADSRTMGREFPAGSAFIIACPGGGQRAWFRSSTAITAADNSVTLTAYGTGQNAAPATALDCMGLAGEQAPYLMHLREFRFRVFLDSEGRGYLGFVPNLQTDVSSWPSNGQILAADVEEFQVAYQMNRPLPTSALAATTSAPDSSSGGNSNWVLGDVQGETSLPSTASTMPTLDDAYDTQARYNAHPANIRAVRVNISVRSARQRQGKATAFTRGNMENGPTTGTTGDGYFRTWLTSAVRTPNMTSRAFFLPPLSSAGTAGGNDDGA